MAELFGATPRIKDTAEIGDIAKALALRIQSDANVACVQTAAAAMEHLAKGVMAPFGRYREQIVPPMIERLKERKASVTDAIGAALDAVFSTVRSSIQMSMLFLFAVRRPCPTSSLTYKPALLTRTLKSRKAP